MLFIMIPGRQLLFLFNSNVSECCKIKIFFLVVFRLI